MINQSYLINHDSQVNLFSTINILEFEKYEWASLVVFKPIFFSLPITNYFMWSTKHLIHSLAHVMNDKNLAAYTYKSLMCSF